MRTILIALLLTAGTPLMADDPQMDELLSLIRAQQQQIESLLARAPGHADYVVGVTLEPDLVEFSFSGSEVVTVEVVEPTASVVLNAVELEIDSAAT